MKISDFDISSRFYGEEKLSGFESGLAGWSFSGRILVQVTGYCLGSDLGLGQKFKVIVFG